MSKLDPMRYHRAAVKMNKPIKDLWRHPAFACIAIQEQFSKRASVGERRHVDSFAKMFSPQDQWSNVWFGSISCRENQDTRVLALLLAAEITRTGGL